MEISKLESLVLKAKKQMACFNYSMWYRGRIDYRFRVIIEFANSLDEFVLDSTNIDSLYNYLKKRNNGSYSDSSFNTIRRFFHILISLDNEENIKVSYGTPLFPCPNKFFNIKKAYFNICRNNGVSEKSIHEKQKNINRFLYFLDFKDVEIEEIDFKIIQLYKEYLHNSNNAEITISDKLQELKKFLIFLSDKNIIDKRIATLVSGINYYSDAREASYYSQKEIDLLLDQIDRTTIIGKRDFLLILFAVELGLRQSDILNLKFDNFNFKKRTLNIITQKTKFNMEFPLSESLMLAIGDYIKNSRSIISSNLLFPNINPIAIANKQYTYNGLLCARVSKYFKQANINIKGKHHGGHALRHSLVSELLREGEPVNIVSKVLTHKSVVTTSKYLWLSPNNLRDLALEVPDERY